MNQQQLVTLKADINSPSNAAALGVAIVQRDGNVIATFYNQMAAPSLFVFRTSVPISEIMGNGFDWSRVDNATVGHARIWEWMTKLDFINPSQANVVVGINSAFPAAADDTMRAGIFGHCQRAASKFEKLFATGAGTTVTSAGVGPATMAVEGPLTGQDVLNALDS